MTSTAWRLRFVTLLAAGTLSVHELRYVLAFGRHAERAAADQGHAYLSVLVPVIAVVLAAGVVQLLWRLADRGSTETLVPRLGRLWVTASIALIAAYSLQEWVEGILASGHPAGIAGIVGHGGWIAFVLALGVGALIALALRGAAVTSSSSKPSAWLACPQPSPDPVSPLAWPRPPLDTVARHLAGRGPPLPSV